ncbi:MAG: redoxin domain-containing protein [Bacteroidota bacterium]
MKTLYLMIACMLTAGVYAQNGADMLSGTQQSIPQEPVNERIEMIDISLLDTLRNSSSDTLYIINFWATWCKPCVEELPAFERLYDMFFDKKVRILLISNDSRRTYDSKLKEFVRTKNIKSEVLWMQSTNPDAWINTVHESWSGAIPATLIIKPKTQFVWFKEGEITFNELIQYTTQHLN